MRKKGKRMKWDLTTDKRSDSEVNASMISEALAALQQEKVEFVILTPSHPVQGSNFLQACYDEDIGFAVEVSKESVAAENLLFRARIENRKVVERIFLEYFLSQNAPDISGWEFYNSYPHKKVVEKGQIRWNFPDTIYQDTEQFINDLLLLNPATIEPVLRNVAISLPSVSIKMYFLKDETFKVKDNEEVGKEKNVRGRIFVPVLATCKAVNGRSFTTAELLMDIQNQVAGRNAGMWEDCFSLEKYASWAGVPLLQFDKGGFGRLEMPMASTGEGSLYFKIHEAIRTYGKLPENFSIQAKQDDGQIRFVDGAWDGICYYHHPQKEPVLAPVIHAICMASDGNTVEAEKLLQCIWKDSDCSLLSYAFGIQQWLLSEEVHLHLERLFYFAWNLLELSEHKEIVKLGLFLLGLIECTQSPELKTVIREIGQSDEFTFLQS